MRIGWLILGVMFSATPLGAAPLDRKQLPADVAWFVHVDLDAARESDVVKNLRGLWLKQPAAKQWLASFRDATGSDALADFHGITVFNTSFAPNQGVAIIRGDLDRDRILATTAKLPDHRTTAHGPHELHLWTDPKTGGTSAGAFFGKDTALIGSNERAVSDELDLLDGKGKSLADRHSPLSEAAPAGTVLELGAGGLATARDLPFESAVLRQAENLTASLGEKDERVFFRGRLLLQSAGTAVQVRNLLEGMRAMGLLRVGDDCPLGKLLAALQITAEDRSVRIQWDVAGREVLAAVLEAAQKNAAPPATQSDSGKESR